MLATAVSEYGVVDIMGEIREEEVFDILDKIKAS